MQNGLGRIAVYTGCLACIVVLFALGGEPFFGMRTWVSNQTAAVFSVPSITVAKIHQKYESKVRILIVPGHQPSSGGTEFKTARERDIVADIAYSLAELLAKNPHVEVMVSRGTSSWNPVLQSYFDTHKAEIEAFVKSQHSEMQSLIAGGSIARDIEKVYHNTTPAKAAIMLYGINKWSSENDIDITLHLHINDDAERRKNVAGKYNGFAVYVPDHQYSNADASMAIGEAIAARLNMYHATSTLPIEDAGVVEDQELIAIGSNNTVDGAAILIEYGYIYEPQFQNASVRPAAVADYAYETYLGLQDFFKDPVAPTFGTPSLPYDWSKVAIATKASGPGVYALQTALRYLDLYPPARKSFDDCPISGLVGPCTIAAVNAYQSTRGLEATGTLGPKTRDALLQDLSIPR